MAKPSLSATAEGIALAEQSLQLLGLSKTGLSRAVGCSRQPVTNFFKGAAIEQGLFVVLCDRLNLNWQQIAGLASSVPSAHVSALPASEQSVAVLSGSDTVETLVGQLRMLAKESLITRCGTMRVLDMERPVGLEDIYTSVNILEQMSGHQRRRLADLIADVEVGTFDRLGFGAVTQPRVPVMAAVTKYQKLIILGKPGAGKTTFLKHLAMQCVNGRFAADRLALFVNLKQFAENPQRLGLFDYAAQQHFESELSALSKDAIARQKQQLKKVLKAGQGLILLDGLDEVSQDAHARVIVEIRRLSEAFQDNQFLMTCRIAAWEYTFESFTEVEIADFDSQQIQTFAQQWFRQKALSAQDFLRRLQRQPRLQELCSTPLLLTLLCLAFESSSTLPDSRTDLYREGIETLLKKWDASRGIHRDQVYQKLSIRRKQDLLGQIALFTFKERQLFIRQRDLEGYIADYIDDLPEASEDSAVVQLDSNAILRSIEAQHGLLVERAKHFYSFSHLTFHEYFAARELVTNSDHLQQTMVELVANYAFVPQWREVFLLVSELLRNGDLLLSPLLTRVQSVLEGSDRLQAFLSEIVQLSSQPCFEGCRPVAVRAFLFDIDFDIDQNRTVAVRLDRAANWLVCASFLTRMLPGLTLSDAIAQVKAYDEARGAITRAGTANDAMMIAIEIALESDRLPSEMSDLLHTLHTRMEAAPTDDEVIESVADAARQAAKTRHQIGQEWTFDNHEKQLLKTYYRGTRLLVDCLYSDGCMVSKQRRRSIESALFVPNKA